MTGAARLGSVAAATGLAVAVAVICGDTVVGATAAGGALMIAAAVAWPFRP